MRWRKRWKLPSSANLCSRNFIPRQQMRHLARIACLPLLVLFSGVLDATQRADWRLQSPRPSASPADQPPSQRPAPQPTPKHPRAAGETPPLADPELQKRERELLEQEEELQKKEQSSRILGVVPQFDVTHQNAAPLTPRQKFHLFRRSAFDPFQFALAGIQAGISQANNNFAGYGQGAQGYAKRFGAAFADQLSSNFFSNFAYPVLLKEDPRYFRLGEGSVKRRILYALEQEFVTHTDKGTRRFNFSNVLGAFTAGGISNAYYPSNDRGFGLTVSRAGIALLYGSIGGLIDEFWTDLDRKLFHKKKNTAATPPTSTNPPPH
jgi:hypothetical protein